MKKTKKHAFNKDVYLLGRQGGDLLLARRAKMGM